MRFGVALGHSFMNSNTVTSDPSFLAAATLFSPLPVPVLAKIFASGSLRRYANGDVLFRPGDQTEEMFVVKTGVIEICRVDPDTGGDKVVAYIGEGDAIAGPFSLVDLQPRGRPGVAPRASHDPQCGLPRSSARGRFPDRAGPGTTLAPAPGSCQPLFMRPCFVSPCSCGCR